MTSKTIHIAALALLASLLVQCSPRTFTSRYYYQHAAKLDSIKTAYQELYREGPFAAGFADKQYRIITLQIITDTLTYIYTFDIKEPRLSDTLTRFKRNAGKITELLTRMQVIRCTWIKYVDYYVDQQKNALIFLSVKPKPVDPPFSYKKYYILTYFSQPQYFDEKGQLLDRKKQKRIRQLNGDIFYRINDKVAYTISGDFR